MHDEHKTTINTHSNRTTFIPKITFHLQKPTQTTALLICIAGDVKYRFVIDMSTLKV